MWVVGESSVSIQGRQRLEGWESKAEAETNRIRKQKTKKPKIKNEGREIDIVNVWILVFSVKYIFHVLFLNNFVLS